MVAAFIKTKIQSKMTNTGTVVPSRLVSYKELSINKNNLQSISQNTKSMNNGHSSGLCVYQNDDLSIQAFQINKTNSSLLFIVNVHGLSVLTVMYQLCYSILLVTDRNIIPVQNLECFNGQLVSPRHQCLVPHQKRYSLSQFYCFVCQLPCQIEGKGFDQGKLQPCHLYQH